MEFPTSTLSILPREHLVPILRNLDFASVLNFRQTCTSFHNFVGKIEKNLQKRKITSLKITFNMIKQQIEIIFRHPDEWHKILKRFFANRKRNLRKETIELQNSQPSTSGFKEENVNDYSSITPRIGEFLRKILHKCDLGTLMLEEIQLNDSLLENIENVLKEEKVTITHLKLQFCCLKRVSAHRWKRFFSSINPIEVSLSHLRNVKPQHFDFVFWEKCGKCVFFDLTNVTMIECNDEIHSRISHFLETTRAKWLCLDFPQSDLTNSSFLNILLNRSDLKNIVKNWRLTLVETVDFTKIETELRKLRKFEEIWTFKRFPDNRNLLEMKKK